MLATFCFECSQKYLLCNAVVSLLTLGFRNIENAIICYTTLPGNSAARNEQTRSPYVKILVKVISENAHHMHLIQMLNKIIYNI